MLVTQKNVENLSNVIRIISLLIIVIICEYDELSYRTARGWTNLFIKIGVRYNRVYIGRKWPIGTENLLLKNRVFYCQILL